MARGALRQMFDRSYPAMLKVGLDPLKFRDLLNLARFSRERREFLAKGGVINAQHAILGDYRQASGNLDPHYFNQDLLVASYIHDAAPQSHCDVGSRIDGFVAHVAAFRPIDVLDIRPPPKMDHPNIRFRQANLMEPQAILRGAYQSVSCLHALEHFGLGRYNDPIDPEGHRKGLAAVADLVTPCGTLYISVPVGKRRTVFNAHRILHPQDIIDWTADRFELARFDFVDDDGRLNRDSQPADAAGLDYGCGIYTLSMTRS